MPLRPLAMNASRIVLGELLLNARRKRTAQTRPEAILVLDMMSDVMKKNVLQQITGMLRR